MAWRIEILHKSGVFDSHGVGVQKDILDLGIDSISDVESVRVYNLHGDISRAQAESIARKILTDPVTQTSSVTDKPPKVKKLKTVHYIEVAHNPGVMDPVEGSTLKAISDLGVDGVRAVRTATKYILKGQLSPRDKKTIVEKILSNKIIQHEVDHSSAEFIPETSATEQHFKLLVVDIIGASERKLMNINTEGQLFLNKNELKTIQAYYTKLGRNPTDVELETIAQTWSEHCYHKTFRGNIKYTETVNGKTKTRKINNLLKSTIAKATHKLNKSWCVSVFHDNAGVIKFDNEDDVCFKVETHNHPSALEPFGGANTGIGGVIRDILGTGLGAKPVCSTDVFCFAPPDMAFKDLPPGTLHPKRVMKGVVSGVRDYGNKMGIPTVNGAVVFDPLYVGNPLVYCGNVGIIPKDKVFKKVGKGDLIVALGGKTGRDGIHGATFSSGELTTESETVSSGAVQIGDPIQEKKVADALLKARDAGLYSAVTDCGAGGFSSAVGEMGEELGARVDLDKAPLKYQGLTYTEIWISESQERMVVSVPPKNIDKFLKIFKDENVEATVLGQFTGSGRLELFYNDVQVCDLDMRFLHDGMVKVAKEAVWTEPKIKPLPRIKDSNFNEALLDCLSHYNVCSKEWIIRQYDHEVQGGSVVKPLTGIQNDGPSDASVITPKLGSKKGIAVSNGINPLYGKIDPYWMAQSCIDEAVRQVVCVGGDPEHIAILDNFCWGNPDKPDRLGGLVRCSIGCYDAAVKYGTPFISGKDSLYNEYTEGKKSIAIPGTLLISAIGIVHDVTKTVTMDLKSPGNYIYMIGRTYSEMGGSVYAETEGRVYGDVPRTKPAAAVKSFKALAKAIKKGLIRSAHDCSDGGFAVALAEMSFAGGLGATAMLSQLPKSKSADRDDVLLFSESNSRILVEVEPSSAKAFEGLMKGIPHAMIGKVEGTTDLTVFGASGAPVISEDILTLKAAWQNPLKW